MTAPRDPDARIAAFFGAPQPDLPDRTFDAVRGDIHQTRQVVVIGPWRQPSSFPSVPFIAAMAAVLAVVLLLVNLRPVLGPSGVPTPVPTPTVAPSPAGPTAFTSPLYGYSATIPSGWETAPAAVRWDGQKQPGPDAEADKFAGPGELTSWAFAGPFSGDLAAFVADRIVANARDHSDTCPRETPEINEPLQVRGRQWVLIGWNCGAVINQAVTVRAGVAYAFVFRDLGIKAATDPADRALFLSILDSVELP